MSTRTADERVAVATPTARAAARRAAPWAALAAAVVLAAVIVTALTAGGPRERFSPHDPSAEGSMAVAEVLREQGVDVVPTTSLAQTRAAVADGQTTTIVLADRDDDLSSSQRRELLALAHRLVVLEPDLPTLVDLAPPVASAGAADPVLHADCSLPAVQRAGRVSGTSQGYRMLEDPAAADATLCLGSGDGVYSIVDLPEDATRVTVVGTGAAFTNRDVDRDGNAALALTLLGVDPTLVWYLPSEADVAARHPSLASLSPDWVPPLAVLAALTALAAALWRGRRLGPLVVERLPVHVRASETMEGRARLYERARARLRALDALRMGALTRLAALVGLPRTAPVDDIVEAVAELTGRHPRAVRDLVLDAVPRGDRELVRLSDALASLEADAVARVAARGRKGEWTP